MWVIDIETHDPKIYDLGDGSMRCDGEILLAGAYNGREYHCFTKETGFSGLKEIIESGEDLCAHNGIYDFSWLCCSPLYGFKLAGRLHDTMTRMALIDEYADLGLDACCRYFGIEGKNAADTIEAWYEQRRKELGLKGKLWLHTSELWQSQEFRDNMRRYNEQDCLATWRLFQAQEPRMREGSIMEAYDIECRLYPLVLEMKRNGVRLDLQKFGMLRDEVRGKTEACARELEEVYSVTPEVIRSPKQLGEKMRAFGIKSSVKTPSGADSWSSDALERVIGAHAVVPKILEYKALDTLLNKYLYGSLDKSLIGDRIHCTFSPNKRADGGTVTGRWSCKTPNLQNISARDYKHGQKTYGQEMRELFVPEDGCAMLAIDYSQIEYLLLAHYAKGPQAEWFKAQANAGVDFHTAAMDITGFKVRDIVKRINYGVIYGMGTGTFVRINYLALKRHAEEAGMSDAYAYAADILSTYHRKLPVIKDTMNWVQSVSKQQGYIDSIGGRRHHKPKPAWQNGKLNDFIYKMTNYLIQGSAADILKKGLLDAWDSGVFSVLKMHLTVHDENVVSCPKTREGVEAGWHLEQCMNNAYRDRLSVPMKAVGGYGMSWGDKHSEEAWAEEKLRYGFGSQPEA